MLVLLALAPYGPARAWTPLTTIPRCAFADALFRSRPVPREPGARLRVWRVRPHHLLGRCFSLLALLVSCHRPRRPRPHLSSALCDTRAVHAHFDSSRRLTEHLSPAPVVIASRRLASRQNQGSAVPGNLDSANCGNPTTIARRCEANTDAPELP